ncbi:hypothetical protein KFL_009030040, partial [Klebsormidium nitens]
ALPGFPWLLHRRQSFRFVLWSYCRFIAEALGQTLHGSPDWVDNSKKAVQVVAAHGLVAPRKVLLDGGSFYSMAGAKLKAQLGLTAADMDAGGHRVHTATGKIEALQGGLTRNPVPIILNAGTPEKLTLYERLALTDSTGYDLLVGTRAAYPAGLSVDRWTEEATYRADWRGEGRVVGRLPMRLHQEREEKTRGAGEGGSQEQGSSAGPGVPHDDAARRRAKVDRVDKWRARRWPRGPPLDVTREAEAAVKRAIGEKRRKVAVPQRIEIEQLRGCQPLDWRVIQPLPRDRPLRVLELFAGVGAATQALARVGYQDIRLVTREQLSELGPVDLVVAGWPCQGSSAAGTGQGLDDGRSGLVVELLRVMRNLQALHQGWGRQLGYLIEHVAAGFDKRPKVREHYEAVRGLLGPEVVVDAAQLGSRAHRLRAWWTNLEGMALLREALSQQKRPEGLFVGQVLGAGRRAKQPRSEGVAPWAKVERPGEARRALNTFVSYSGSYAFSRAGGGVLRCERPGGQVTFEEPTAEERELAMGFPRGFTAAPGVSENLRRELLGQTMDLNTVMWLLAACRAGGEARARAAASGARLREAEGVAGSARHGRNEAELAAGAVGYEQLAGRSVEALLEAASAQARGEASAVSKPGEQEQSRQGPGAGAGGGAQLEGPGPPRGTVAGKGWTVGAQLNEEKREYAAAVAEKNRDVFAFSLEEIGEFKLFEVELDLKTEQPIFERRRKHIAREWELVDERCQELEKAGIIEECESDFAANSVMAAKKDPEGNWKLARFYTDLRRVNEQTAQDRYPMPLPEDVLEGLGHARFYSTIDVRGAFHQLVVRKQDRRKLAFWSSNKLYCWKRCPFGARNASAWFQRAIDRTLRGLEGFARSFVDDLLVAGGETLEEHMELVQRVLDRLREVGLKCHPEKCCFGADLVEYLGMWLRPGVVSPQVAKVAAIAALPRPTDVTRVQAPLNELTKKGVSWRWGEEQESAFQALKQALQGSPVLALPRRGRPFRVRCDWSKRGVGGVLLQEDEQGLERVVAYGSRSCNQAESRYSSFEGELLAAVYFVRFWRQYLYGERFVLESDHQPLKWILTNSKLTGKLARWALLLSEFDFEVKHKPGVDNEMDCLSRYPRESQEDSTGVRQKGELESESAPVWSAAACLSWQPSAAVVSGADGLVGALAPVDVWADEALLGVLKGDGYPLRCAPRERDRLQHRARGYEWRGDHLVRSLVSGGQVRVVPRPEVRVRLVKDVHERAGHMGARKTLSLLRPHYWWVGLAADVGKALRGCEACDRVRAAFNAKHPTLQPLPIKGLFYRWGLDFAGPLPRSRRGNHYVLVLVEHFSKTVSLVPTQDKEPSTVAEAFTREVLTRFGAPAEVVTDRGGEFAAEFQACLDAALVDHRATSAHHPQANGLSERVVQVVKRALRKWCLGHAAEDWDLYLPWVAMGYNFSTQASLASFSSYQLVHGRSPVVPGAIKVEIAEPLDLDNEERLVALVAERAKLFERWMPMAMGNLEIAQHRDTLRYAKTRSGAWKPQAVRYEPGDYVYLQREMLDTLDTRAGPHILRVREVAANGRCPGAGGG